MGGHGRALEALIPVLKTNALDGAAVMGSVVTELLKWYPEVTKGLDVDSVTRILIAALTGQLIQTGHKLGNIDPQQLELVRLVYEQGPGGNLYRLMVPYIWLQIMLSQVHDQNQVLKPWGLMDYAQLVRDPSPDDWEKFNSDFRVLKSRTLEDGAETTVEDLHRGAIISSDLTGLHEGHQPALEEVQSHSADSNGLLNLWQPKGDQSKEACNSAKARMHCQR